MLVSINVYLTVDAAEKRIGVVDVVLQSSAVTKGPEYVTVVPSLGRATLGEYVTVVPSLGRVTLGKYVTVVSSLGRVTLGEYVTVVSSLERVTLGTSQSYQASDVLHLIRHSRTKR